MPWPAIAGHGRPWLARARHGRPRPAMAGHCRFQTGPVTARLWLAMASHSQQWLATASKGRQWQTMTSHDSPPARPAACAPARAAARPPVTRAFRLLSLGWRAWATACRSRRTSPSASWPKTSRRLSSAMAWTRSTCVASQEGLQPPDRCSLSALSPLFSRSPLPSPLSYLSSPLSHLLSPNPQPTTDGSRHPSPSPPLAPTTLPRPCGALCTGVKCETWDLR